MMSTGENSWAIHQNSLYLQSHLEANREDLVFGYDLFRNIYFILVEIFNMP
jgi:hypothetical protein